MHFRCTKDKTALCSVTYKINKIIAMKNMKWGKITFAILLISGAFGASAIAQQYPNRSMDERQHRMVERDQTLVAPGQVWMRGLSEEQRERIKTLHLETKEQALGLENQLKEKHARLQTLSTGDQINARGAHSTIEEISKLEAELKKLRWDTRMEIRTLLTDEQKVIFDSFHSGQNEWGSRRQVGQQDRYGQMGRQGQRRQMGPQGRQGHRGQMSPHYYNGPQNQRSPQGQSYP